MVVAALVSILAAAAPHWVVPAGDVRHARGLRQSFDVDGGRLYVTDDGGTDHGKGRALFGGDGRVPGSDEDIVAVFADEDAFFVVVTKDGALHHFESGVFDSLWGLPSLPFTRAPLALPFDVETLRPGRVAYSMRHEHVQHYNDPDQQEFFWGNAGTTTLWVLSDDGRQLLLGDPWLPPDFSRELCAPRDCSLRMAAVAASASTVFVVGVDGSLYTRFVDYDSFGGTPFYDYDYRAFAHEGLRGDDPASELQTRALPAEDWTVQPPPPSTRISRRIAITQTGTGNDARMLSVIGEHDDGHGGVVRGVFFKGLRDVAWGFSAADVVVDDADWLDASDEGAGVVPARAYSGFARGNAVFGNVFAATDDFWFFRSPFHLELVVDGEPVRLIVHTVDSWTLFTTTNPRTDEFATQLLKATIVVAPNQTLSPRTRARVDALLSPRIGEPFAFSLVASQHELRLFASSYPWNVARSRFELVLRHDPATRAQEHLHLHPYRQIAATIGATSGCDPTRARAALAAVVARHEKATSELGLSRAIEAGLPAATGLADLLSVVTTARFTWRTTRWLTGLELHLPAVLGAQVVSREEFVEASEDDFAAVSADLRRCAR